MLLGMIIFLSQQRQFILAMNTAKDKAHSTRLRQKYQRKLRPVLPETQNQSLFSRFNHVPLHLATP
jgi:hypothetical protein